jgi:methionyl-tRNA synthetase
MSKSLGNVVDPFEVLRRYGVDPMRHYLLRDIPSDEDGDFSEKRLRERYNTDLANNLGNLVSRTATLAEKHFTGGITVKRTFLDSRAVEIVERTRETISYAFDSFMLHSALGSIFELSSFANAFIDERKPWKESPEELLKTMINVVYLIAHIGHFLEPFLPQTAKRIREHLGIPDGTSEYEGRHFAIKKGEALFPRL